MDESKNEDKKRKEIHLSVYELLSKKIAVQTGEEIKIIVKTPTFHLSE